MPGTPPTVLFFSGMVSGMDPEPEPDPDPEALFSWSRSWLESSLDRRALSSKLRRVMEDLGQFRKKKKKKRFFALIKVVIQECWFFF